MPFPLIALPKSSPNLPDFRIAGTELRAERTRQVWPKAKGKSLAQKDGHRYETKVAKALALHVNQGHFIRLERNPWFNFHDVYGTSNCAPDLLLWVDEKTVIIVEVKLTWVEVAAHKLADLYYPVIRSALEVEAWPLIICRNLQLTSPPAKHTLCEAMASEYRLMHWPEIGALPW